MIKSKVFQDYAAAKAFYAEKEKVCNECSLASAKGAWIVQYADEDNTPLVLQVYKALCDVKENNNTVYLENVDIQSLDINAHQFAGYCAQLERMGLYKKTIDPFFGEVLQCD